MIKIAVVLAAFTIECTWLVVVEAAPARLVRIGKTIAECVIPMAAFAAVVIRLVATAAILLIRRVRWTPGARVLVVIRINGSRSAVALAIPLVDIASMNTLTI